MLEGAGGREKRKEGENMWQGEEREGRRERMCA